MAIPACDPLEAEASVRERGDLPTKTVAQMCQQAILAERFF